MSRNKIIKFVHERTGKSYAECRKICKCAHWNEATIIAYTLADATGILTKTISGICSVIMDAAAQISKSLSTVFDGVADSMREQSERMRALAKPIDVNDPKTPVFAPYYASKAKDGKLYQNDDKGI